MTITITMTMTMTMTEDHIYVYGKQIQGGYHQFRTFQAASRAQVIEEAAATLSSTAQSNSPQAAYLIEKGIGQEPRHITTFLDTGKSLNGQKFYSDYQGLFIP